MTYVRFPYAILARIGAELNQVSEELQGKNRDVIHCDGLDDTDMRPVHKAIDDFGDAWQRSLDKLLKDIGQWGAVSTSIGTLVQQYDDAVAAALRPPDSPSAVPPSRS